MFGLEAGATEADQKLNELDLLSAACENGDVAKLGELLSSMTDEEREKALSNTNYRTQQPQIRQLEEQLEEMGMIEVTRNSLLSLAVTKDKLECVKLLLDMGANVNGTSGTFDRSTVLHLAISQTVHEKEIFTLLLDKVCDVNAADEAGVTPLHLAVKNEDMEKYIMLIEKGAAVNTSDKGHMTPLHTAWMNGKMEFVNMLLERGGELEEKNPRRLTMLHIFAKVGKVEDLKKSFKNGSDVNAGTVDGETPAFLATNDVDGRENPCLALLINHYHAMYLSRHAAMLTKDEHLFRAKVFIILAAVIGGSCYPYFIINHDASTSCLRAYDGMLLPPYLFIFVCTLLFKVAQYLFEEVMMPALDFFLFVTDSSKPREIKILQGEEHHSASKKVSLVDTYRDSIPSAMTETSNPMSRVHQVGAGGDVELGPLGIPTAATSPTATNHHTKAQSNSALASSASDFASSTSLLLYRIFGEIKVKNWRLKKYRSAHKTAADYLKDDFSHAPYRFLYLQFIWGYVSLIMAAIHVDRSLPAWQQYTNFFATIVYSGIPTTILSCIKMALLDKRGDQMLKNGILGYLILIWLILIPPIFTHSVPGSLLYFWIMAVFTMIPQHVGLITIQIKPSPLALYFLNLFAEVVLRFFLVLYLQTFFNYSSLFYDLPLPINGYDYIGVVEHELALRSQMQCFMNEALQSSRGVIAFFSWL